MSQFKRKLPDGTYEVIGDKSLPIRYLPDGTPADDDYVVFDDGTGSKRTTVGGLILHLPYLTTAPTSDNTDGLILVVLSSEPSTRYNGYIYFITEE